MLLYAAVRWCYIYFEERMSEETSKNSDCSSPLGFIAVHIGAGFHSPTNNELFKRICHQACVQAVALLRLRKPAREALEAAMMSLEDSPYTNAGTGSNLTLTGTVECDASIMEGRTLQYGAVGALSGVRNPILVAKNLLETQLKGNFSLGRIPPSTMVGQGAFDWAVKQGIPTVMESTLITEMSRETFKKNKRKVDILEKRQTKLRKVEKQIEEVKSVDGIGEDAERADVATTGADADWRQKLDTVGAVCMDHTGNIASAVSSGGIILKHPGRLGQAALFACGCWSENDDKVKSGIGISTSGAGEHLTKALLAKVCADSLRHTDNPTESLGKVFQDQFLGCPLLRDTPKKLGGAVALKADYSNPNEYSVEVLWAHTTDSMCLAFMPAAEDRLTALISRLPGDKESGKTCLVQSECFTLSKTVAGQDKTSNCDTSST